MLYLLDTNIVIHARDGHIPVIDAIEAKGASVAISALTLAELQRGMAPPAVDRERRAIRLDVMLRVLPVLPFDAAAASAYGRVLQALGWARGRDVDRMIAGHAIAAGRILVTANVSDFSDIPHLRIENWAV